MDPFSATVGPVFTFPDRYGFLERVDEPLPCLERIGSVRRTDRDSDTGFAHLEMAHAVDDRATSKRPPRSCFGF